MSAVIARPAAAPPELDGAQPGSDRWWRALAHRGAPLREPAEGDSQWVTFCWRQPHDRATEHSATRAVFIDVYSHTPHPVHQGPTALQQLAGTDLWYWRARLPRDWCGSYFFAPATEEDLPVPEPLGERRRWWIDLIERRARADVLNPEPPHNGGWGQPLSGIYPQAPRYPEAEPAGERVEHRWQSPRLSRARRTWLYRPRPSAGPLPLVLLLDGHYWIKQRGLLAQLDQLTASGELPPAAYLFIDSIDGAARGEELPCNAAFWLALQEELLPALEQRAALSRDPARTLVAGQSFGGLAAVYAALHWPQRFGLAFSQSGSFWWPDIDDCGSGGQLAQQLRDGGVAETNKQKNKPRFLLEIGQYESDMLADNRALRDALAAAGCEVHYREFAGGHDWLCWRRGLLAGIAELLQE
ncbi:enterochelin esterase [Microbulbifer litoralis]|uniref:enterochelin esterase n=1 Tax=Microbulbifer litoralis TaxID=2933965 RepID=UPI002027963E